MCTATFAKLQNKTLAARLREKIAVNDPASKALGYEGLADPFGEFMHRRAGTKHELDIKQEKLRDRRALAARTAEATPTGGHIQSIAAYKARTGRS